MSESSVTVTDAPYGEWKSPLTAADVAEAGRSITSIRTRPDGTGSVFFLQARGDGTTSIFCVPGSSAAAAATGPASTGPSSSVVVDVLPREHSASSRLYEYGGSPYTVLPITTGGRANEQLVFSDGRDGALRVLDVRSGNVGVVTKPRDGIRYGDLAAADGADDHVGGRWVLAVQEDHTGAASPADGGEEDPAKVKNYVVAVDVRSGTVTRIAEGADFYASPRFASAAGSAGSSVRRLCWLEWDFPDMPWEGVRLCWAAWDPTGTGRVLGNVEVVAGGGGGKGKAGKAATRRSVAEPRWSPDGQALYFAMDTGDWRQLYRRRVGASDVEQITLEGLEEVDFGAAMMSMGPNTYGFLSPTSVVAAYAKNGRSQTILADVQAETWVSLDVPLVDLLHDSLCVPSPATWSSPAAATINQPSVFYAVGASQTSTRALYKVSLSSPHVPSPAHPQAPIATLTAIRYSASPDVLPASYVSRPLTLAVPSPTDSQPERMLHGLFYAPHNPKFKHDGTGRERAPPLIVTVHGGPISLATSSLSLETQFFTTRGYAVLAVNPAGSTPSFGAAHRDALYGYWGVRDAAETSLLVRHLVDGKRVDGSRVGITGGSAGGYAVLRALTTRRGGAGDAYHYAAGVCLYGIAELASLLSGGTHKMESAYGDLLVFGRAGVPGGKERKRILDERSPVHHVSRVDVPLLLLHGDADRVVPIAQARAMVDAMEKAGRKTKGPDADVRLVVFKGEGHGFRTRDALVKALEETEAWWRRTLLVNKEK